ncbi:MAG: pilus assembly protein PilM, partial [Planctomycetaceae bacterium]|nr:pilus assembly protein PilM [Planctomycetaceae bacterium]
VDTFKGLAGDHVLNAPLFQDNLLTFVVPYGLAIQALKLTEIRTTLLPPEIALERKIRRKKPWAVATAATLLIGLATSAAGYGSVWHSVSKARFGAAEEEAGKVETEASGLKSKYSGEVGKNKTLQESGQKLVGSLQTREYWVEVYKAVDECLPRDVGNELDKTEIRKLKRISLRSITCKKHSDLAAWFSSPAITEGVKSHMSESDAKTGPTGAGYVFTLQGVHYHDEKEKPSTGQGVNYVRATLLTNLQSAFVNQGEHANGGPNDTPVRVIGISHATVSTSSDKKQVTFYPNGKPNAGGGRQSSSPFGGAIPTGGLDAGRPGGVRPVIGEEDKGPGQPIQIWQTNFTVQFVWKPTPLGKARDDIAAAAAAVVPPQSVPANAPTSPTSPISTPPTSVTPPPTGALPATPPAAPGG